MNLKPKHSLTRAADVKNGIERGFVGRVAPRKDLKNAVDEKRREEHSVIHYYGIGGIGKTRLQKEMAKEIEAYSTSTMIGHLNFEAAHLIRVDGALLELREQLKSTYKVQFDLFDLACAVLWKKVNPHLSLQANQKDLPFIEEGNYLGEIISLVDGLPLVQWLPKTIQFAQSVSTQLRKWKILSGKLSAVMKEISSLQAFEIEERLPLFFAEDIKQFLSKKSLTPVIFIDTYEALSNKDRHHGLVSEQEEWIKELILQLPEVLWVVFGRERLEWDRAHLDWKNIIKQEPVLFLSVENAEEFLIEGGVVDQSIRKKMIEVSNGLPYQLDLLLDTYELIRERKMPDENDFTNSSNLIVDRLIGCLTLPERELLKVLSFPRKWNESLFKSLIAKLSIGYPATAIEELCRFSFISKITNDNWQMHPIMRMNFQSIVKKEQIPFYEHVHQVLFYEYKKQLEDLGPLLDSTAEDYLNEMAYHAAEFELTEIEERTLVEITNRFYHAGRFKLFTPFSQELKLAMNTFTSEFSSAQYYAIAGHVAAIQGDLDSALEQFELADKHLINVASTTDGYFELLLQMKSEAANIHIKRTSYEEARRLLLSACALESKMDYINIQLVQVNIQLGKLEKDSFNKAAAKKYYDQALELVDELLAQDKNNINSLSLKGSLYEKFGEWLSSKNLIEQRGAYRSSVECYEKAKSLSQSLPLEMEADSGLAWKRLAENYSKQDELKNETIQAFQMAISIYDGILVANSDYIEVHIKKGHAAVDFLCFLGKCGMYEDAEENFELAIASFTRAIEQSTDQVSAQNRLASAYREMANIYYQIGSEELAMVTFNKAIEESNRLIRHYPEYRYGEKTLEKTYKYMNKLGLLADGTSV